MDDVTYNNTPGIRWSTLVYGLTSALELKRRIEAPGERTDAMRLGSVGHLAVLEPELYREARVIAPPEYVTAKGELRDTKDSRAWLSNVDADAVVTAEQDADFHCVVAAVNAHDDAGEWLRMSQKEVVWTWRERIEHPDAHGQVSPFPQFVTIGEGYVEVTCKAKADLFTRGIGFIGDLKFYGKTFTIRALQAEFWNRNMQAQFGWYKRGAKANGETVLCGGTIFTQRKAPHDVCCFEHDGDVGAEGDADAEQALMVLVNGCVTGKWPGIAPKRVALTVPGWRYDKSNPTDADSLGLEGFDDDEQ